MTSLAAQPWPPHDIEPLDVSADPFWRNPFAPEAPEPGRFAQAAATVEYGVWLAARADLIDARTSLYGRELTCSCWAPIHHCHRSVLADLADQDIISGSQYGHAVALTVRRPWASLLLVPAALGGKTVENRTWTTPYRGPVLIIAGTRIDDEGIHAARAQGLNAQWHTDQRGWLGAAVLTDIHPADGTCCGPWGAAPRADKPLYHWIFQHPARLARPAHGVGFLGLRKASWTNLIRRNAFHHRTPPVEYMH